MFIERMASGYLLYHPDDAGVRKRGMDSLLAVREEEPDGGWEKEEKMPDLEWGGEEK